MTYTVRDTPQVTARIERDLAKVAAEAKAGDPRLRSIILTGGFARGEGAVRNGEPQNDYDLVAVRDPGPVRRPYEETRLGLEDELGIHIDLAPVQRWRLPLVPASIFWYETALRGRTVWGEDLLHKIPRRGPETIPPKEALRLLVNRSAGLLLATEQDAQGKRLQAAKAILAAMDASLLAENRFAPSQTERWSLVQEHAPAGAPPRAWLEWAYRYKTDPSHAPRKRADAAWAAARKAVLDALPRALEHADLDLDGYARSDGAADHLFYALRSKGFPQRIARHPTGTVRVATVKMLVEASPRSVPQLPEDVRRMAPEGPSLVALERLRQATLQ